MTSVRERLAQGVRLVAPMKVYRVRSLFLALRRQTLENDLDGGGGDHVAGGGLVDDQFEAAAVG